MSVLRRIRWGWVLAAALLAEAAILAVFFLLLGGAMLAGVPEIAAPMSTLDNIDALVSSFVMFYLLTLWLGKRIDSDFVLHGALVGLTGFLLFTAMWIGTTDSLDQPLPYLAAHCLKVLGGIAGGLAVAKQKQRLPLVKTG
jgi:hypothetical protein